MSRPSLAFLRGNPPASCGGRLSAAFSTGDAAREGHKVEESEIFGSEGGGAGGWVGGDWWAGTWTGGWFTCTRARLLEKLSTDYCSAGRTQSIELTANELYYLQYFYTIHGEYRAHTRRGHHAACEA